MIIGYSRVSTAEQNLDRQLASLHEARCEKIFTDKITGTKTSRQGLEQLYSHARAGDTVLFDSLDRIGRTLPVIFEILDKLFSMGCEVRVLKQNLIYSPDDPFSKLMFQQFAAFAEFERALTRHRQGEGIKQAHKRGVKFGRRKSLTSKQVKQAKTEVAQGKSMTNVAIDLGVGRTTLWRALQA